MVKVLVTGAAGMIGRKFCQRLVKTAAIAGSRVQALTMADVVPPAAIPGAPFAIRSVACDLASPQTATQLVEDRPDIILHAAAVVSGEAEAEFEKGYQINLAATYLLFEAVRQASYRPRLVFTSSIAVFGAPFPEKIGEDFLAAPLTSYGSQKAIGELLLADYSRRGFFDGVGIRLPTICVRPGKPNKAASGFFSNIIREPLNGEPAVLPVSEEVRHWFASPRSAVGFIFRAAELDGSLLGARRCLTMPGLSITIGEMIASVARAAGTERVELIRRQPDPFIQRIVEGWPRDFDTTRARSLGFEAETSFDAIVQAHIEDEQVRI
jgi:D-erythronate 2-dehydrogenase